jgi:hypothetical protein
MNNASGDHADGRSDDAGLGEWCIDHAIGTELLVQTARGAEHATELSDILAEHDDAWVGLHLQAQRITDRFDDVHRGHRA